MITLYDYYRSSASYRVRIALALKGLEHRTVTVDLAAGAHREDAYRRENPQGTVPYLIDGQTRIGQSLAIIEYLDERYPETAPMVSGGPEQRAFIRQLSQIVACDIHPLNNLKVWKGYIAGKMGADEAAQMEWFAHWVHQGFAALETLLEQSGAGGPYCAGDAPGMADACLIPQLYNARRFKLDLSSYPRLCTIEKQCVSLAAFQQAAPESHRDAPAGLEPIHGPQSPLLV